MIRADNSQNLKKSDINISFANQIILKLMDKRRLTKCGIRKRKSVISYAYKRHFDF